jgi:large subunit ribosomal protein L13
MKTYLPKVEEIEKSWFLFDAEKEVLGKLAVKIADALRGKDQPTYTPHLDTGANVIVINAQSVKLSGKKNTDKEYQRYSGYMGGRSVMTADEVREKDPERMVRQAVQGMLPNGRLARQLFRKLHVYAGVDHPHAAQNPIAKN